MKDVISIRLEKELSERLEALAKATGRSVSWHARQAIIRHIREETIEAYISEQTA